MPNTPDRGKQQPDSAEQRKRQQLNDRSLQGGDDEDTEEGRIEAPGTDEDEEATPLRTEEGGEGEETGEDEDLPDDADTQVSSDRGNEANRRGGQQ